MSLENLMGYAAVFFGILGSWGLWRQARMIWVGKSIQSVSGVWVITSLAMFASFLFYGLQLSSRPMEFQGGIRVVFSSLVVIGFFRFGFKELNWKHWLLVAVYTALLAAMASKTLAPWLFTAFSFLGVWASFVLAATICKNKTRGQVAIELQVIYLVAVVCWLVFAIVRKDWYLTTTSVGFVFSYGSTIVMWLKHP